MHSKVYRYGFAVMALILAGATVSSSRAAVTLKPANTQEGYVARLLINEAPFPGERGWVSEADTQAAMLAVLWVLHSRIHHVPKGYRQSEIASAKVDNIIDAITVGGEKGQCDGFYKDSKGDFKAVARVHKRIDYLLKTANTGTPGKFARLFAFAQGLSDVYSAAGIRAADRFAHLDRVGKEVVTGRAYSWMTAMDYYHPGGDFIRIPNTQDGVLGGNRFYTLRQR